MPTTEPNTPRILIGIPAYNEEMTIKDVIQRTHAILPAHDILVVNDGSQDKTAAIVRTTPAIMADLPCNLGYSSAVETILRYAYQQGYDAVVLIDADGQHDPAYLPDFLADFIQKDCDVLIGSRYIATKDYSGNPFGRRLGMLLFSNITRLLGSQRIYDTTSGMKALKRGVLPGLLSWHFIDFHAEAIMYLLWLGHTIEEHPITVQERAHGTSMYNLFSMVWYPLSVLLLIFVSWIQSQVYKRKAQST